MNPTMGVMWILAEVVHQERIPLTERCPRREMNMTENKGTLGIELLEIEELEAKTAPDSLSWDPLVLD
jgi:hypothetical protein